MFDISSEGNLRMKEGFDLNSTEAHFVILAKDSGTPPRKVFSLALLISFSQNLKLFA